MFPDKYDEDSLPPLGLGYIGTYAKNKGLKVHLIDSIADRISLNDLIHTVNELKPKAIGINIFTTNYHLVKELIESIKIQAKIIIGGLSTKDLHKKIFNWDTNNLIHIVAGDGELITTDIFNDNIQIEPTSAKGNKKYYRIDKGNLYYVNNISELELDRSFFKHEPVHHPLGFSEVNIVTSRGCIFNCSFCAAAYSRNKEFGIRECQESAVLNELHNISKLYPNVNSIRVLDDLFLKKASHVEYATNIFSQTSYNWRSMAHVTTFKNLSDTDMARLKSSGCTELFIGIESGSPTILKTINKTSNIGTIKHNLEKVLKAGISIKGYFIYGFPDETIDDAECTYQLALYLQNLAIKYGSNFRTSVFQYRPYHGTEIFHDLSNSHTEIDNILNINPNIELSDKIDRLQFNFHSGNYSKICDDDLHSYICKTAEINTTNLIEALRNANKSKEKQQV